MGAKLLEDWYGEREALYIYGEDFRGKPRVRGILSTDHVKTPCKIYTRAEIAQLEKELECNK